MSGLSSFISNIELFDADNNVYLLTHTKGGNNTFSITNTLHNSGFCEYAEPNFIRVMKLHGETYQNDQWGIKNIGQYGGIAGNDINVECAWNYTKGNGIRVAVVDGGMEVTHPDLLANIAGYWSAMDSAAIAQGQGHVHNHNAHGTACAGIISAAENGIGIIGVAPQSEFYSVRITKNFGNFGMFEDRFTIAGLKYAWYDAEADILSCSWGGGNPNLQITAEINNAVTLGRNGKGCIVLFAAGNSNNAVSYPASLPNVIAVGAISPCGERKRSSSDPNEVSAGVLPDPAGVSCDNKKTWGSNYGTDLDIMAPGVFISTTDLLGDNGYNTSSITDDYADNDYTALFGGTSAACPYVAGVTALVLSANSNLTSSQVCNILESTARKSRQDLYLYSTTVGRPNGTWHQQMGYGIVDACEAVCATPLYFTNKTITTNTTITHCNDIYVQNVTINNATLTFNTAGNINIQNVTIKNNGKLILDAGGEVNIVSDFDIELGSELEIR